MPRTVRDLRVHENGVDTTLEVDPREHTGTDLYEQAGDLCAREDRIASVTEDLSVREELCHRLRQQ